MGQRKQRRIAATAAMAWLLTASGLCAADPPRFAESAEEIARALSAPATQPVKTRSLILPSKGAGRAIKVLALEDGKAFFEQRMVEGDQPAAVNLKVEFDVNSDAIRPESFGLLAELARALQGDALKGRAVAVRGHSDGDGEEDYNLALSLRRAGAVKAFLTAGFGIAAERLRVEGWGEAQPLAPNDTPQGKQLNRRVEIVTR